MKISPPHGREDAKTADYARRGALPEENGIQLKLLFVLGFDQTPRMFCSHANGSRRTAGMLDVHILTPYPATHFSSKMEGAGLLCHRDWACTIRR